MNSLARGALRAVPDPVKSAVKRVLFAGDNRYCPVCERSSRIFREFGVVRRQDARCPFCGSLERHRMLWRYLQDETSFFQSHGAKMLHVAAEKCFEPRFRRRIGKGYLTADLLQPADEKMDITDIQHLDDSFDIVYCSHVLEHVPDDRKAMREMRRVLKPSGWAIFMVPITSEKTVEDPTITDPQERLRLFGQDDHVRRYGPDFVGRLRDAGFDVTVKKAADFLAADEIERIAVGHPMAGEVFHCTKAAS